MRDRELPLCLAGGLRRNRRIVSARPQLAWPKLQVTVTGLANERLSYFAVSITTEPILPLNRLDAP